ncbi:glycoside hydrolase family 78 protein [Hyunsoonleella rubra]|uniref:galactosylceramidase n=1 Tax=Hyunsoonleella rubra TaxID=1737062 RepID=A0ABW5TE94_9FLAO
MKYLKSNQSIYLLICLVLTTTTWATEVINLQCNGQVNPIGIVEARPEFSWTFVGDANSPKQGGYRIMMATSIEKLKYPDIWDTGPTSTSETGPFKYCGEPLKPGQRVYWMVTAWGNNRGVTHSEPAWFEMGEIENPETPFQPLILPEKDGVVQILLDGNDEGRTFEGIGGVSAGASTDLLYDYEDPIRGQILDILFKPKFGAGFQHLKVEMGGGENSTCGSEPSHAITRDELKNPVSRGYEFWLMKEARNRNPQVILEYLPWSFPYYLKPNIFTAESAEYFVSFLDVAKKQWDMDIDWVAAAENENYTDRDWLVNHVRPLLDSRGYKNVKIQGPDDNSGDWKIFNEFENDKAFDDVVEAVGYHYVTGREFNENMVDGRGRPTTEKAKKTGKPLWASEDWSWTGKDWDGAGALNLARIYNKFYIRDRITKSLIWAPIGSIYKSVTWDKAGAMKANSPWSGYYEVWPTIWATAHTTQFAEPHTWKYLNSACGLFDDATYKGSCVALKEKDGSNWSMVICTETKEDIEIKIADGLSMGTVNIWKSDENEQFVQQESITPENGVLKLSLDPKCIYSLTTTTGQQKGTYDIPEEKAFPFPYTEDYEDRKAGDLPKYHSDQTGSFEIALKEDGSQCLKQIVPEQGYDWMRVYRRSNIKPNTLIGDVNWKNYTCSVDVFIKGGNVELGGRVTTSYLKGYRFQLAKNGEWKLMFHTDELESGRMKKFNDDTWHNLQLTFQDNNLEAFVDGKSITKLSNTKRNGYVMLASSYDENLFDNLKITE